MDHGWELGTMPDRGLPWYANTSVVGGVDSLVFRGDMD